jgi:hypothetical protein
LFLLRGGLWIFFQSIRVSEFGGTRRCAAVRPRKGCRERIPDGNRGPDGKYPSQKGVRCVLRRAPMSPTRRIPGLKCETWGTLLLVMTEPLVSTPSQLLDTRVRGGGYPSSYSARAAICQNGRASWAPRRRAPGWTAFPLDVARSGRARFAFPLEVGRPFLA